MDKKLKITIVPPALDPNGTITHVGTSYQIAKIPNFDTPSNILEESLNDPINLSIYRFTLPNYTGFTVYSRVKLHFSNGTSSRWSRTMPVNADTVGIKKTGTVINTPVIKTKLKYSGNVKSVVVATSNDMSLYAGSGDWKSTSWTLTDIDNQVIWEMPKDTYYKKEIEIPSDLLKADSVYIVKCKHHTVNDESLSGISMISTKVKTETGYRLIPDGPFVSNKWLYFRLYVSTPSYLSIDLQIRDAYGNTVSELVNQFTRTPKILPSPTIPNQPYTVYSRITYTDGTQTPYREEETYIAVSIDSLDNYPNAEYYEKYDYTQEILTGGRTVFNTAQMLNGDILVADHNLNKIMIKTLNNDQLIDGQELLTLDPYSSLMEKPYINIVPLPSGRVLVDFNSVRVIDIDNPKIPATIKTLILDNDLYVYEHESVFIINLQGTIGKTLENQLNLSTGEILIHRPRFNLYDYNTITRKFTLVKSVVRDNELLGTALNNSIMTFENNTGFYIPTYTTTGLYTTTLAGGSLFGLNLDTLEITTLINLPDGNVGNVSLFKHLDGAPCVVGGVNNITTYDTSVQRVRTNDNIYKYTIGVNGPEWVLIGKLPPDVHSSKYSLACYNRKDDKIVCFNNTQHGVGTGDQRTVVFDLNTNISTYLDNDTPDDVIYASTIKLLNNDFLRVSSKIHDPQLVYEYATKLHDDNTFDAGSAYTKVFDLVVPVGQHIEVESLYQYNSITIEGDSDTNTGILKWLDKGNVHEFKWNDLIVTQNTTYVNNLYTPLDDVSYNSITILNNVEYVTINMIDIPANIASTTVINAPFTAKFIKIGDNSELRIETV